MADYWTIENILFLEVNIISLLILGFTMAINIHLYKIRPKETWSRLLIVGVFYSLLDFMWLVLQRVNASPVLIGVDVTLLLSSQCTLSALMLAHVLESTKVKGDLDRFYFADGAVFPTIVLILGVISIFRPILFTVDESGVNMRASALFLLVTINLAHILAALVVAVFQMILHRDDRQNVFMCRTFIIYIGMTLVLAAAAELFLPSEYVCLQIVFALPTLYYTIHTSTRKALDAKARQTAMETDMKLATAIQMDALNRGVPAFPDHPDIDLRASIRPARAVGGDFYDYFQIDDRRVCMLVADVSGKGMPAALFMMKAKTMIRDYAALTDSTAEVFERVNRLLCESNGSTMFVTAWIGILDTGTNVLQFTNAGHNYPYFAHAGKPFAPLTEAHGMVLAAIDIARYPTFEMRLQPGDSLFLYTDGVVEAHNQRSELYGDERLRALLDSLESRSAADVLPRVFDSVNAFADQAEQFDDITLMMLNLN